MKLASLDSAAIHHGVDEQARSAPFHEELRAMPNSWGFPERGMGSTSTSLSIVHAPGAQAIHDPTATSDSTAEGWWDLASSTSDLPLTASPSGPKWLTQYPDTHELLRPCFEEAAVSRSRLVRAVSHSAAGLTCAFATAERLHEGLIEVESRCRRRLHDLLEPLLVARIRDGQPLDGLLIPAQRLLPGLGDEAMLRQSADELNARRLLHELGLEPLLGQFAAQLNTTFELLGVPTSHEGPHSSIPAWARRALVVPIADALFTVSASLDVTAVDGGLSPEITNVVEIARAHAKRLPTELMAALAQSCRQAMASLPKSSDSSHCTPAMHPVAAWQTAVKALSLRIWPPSVTAQMGRRASESEASHGMATPVRGGLVAEHFWNLRAVLIASLTPGQESGQAGDDGTPQARRRTPPDKELVRVVRQLCGGTLSPNALSGGTDTGQLDPLRHTRLVGMTLTRRTQQPRRRKSEGDILTLSKTVQPARNLLRDIQVLGWRKALPALRQWCHESLNHALADFEEAGGHALAGDERSLAAWTPSGPMPRPHGLAGARSTPRADRSAPLSEESLRQDYSWKLSNASLRELNKALDEMLPDLRGVPAILFTSQTPAVRALLQHVLDTARNSIGRAHALVDSDTLSQADFPPRIANELHERQPEFRNLISRWTSVIDTEVVQPHRSRMLAAIQGALRLERPHGQQAWEDHEPLIQFAMTLSGLSFPALQAGLSKGASVLRDEVLMRCWPQDQTRLAREIDQLNVRRMSSRIEVRVDDTSAHAAKLVANAQEISARQEALRKASVDQVPAASRKGEIETSFVQALDELLLLQIGLSLLESKLGQDGAQVLNAARSLQEGAVAWLCQERQELYADSKPDASPAKRGRLRDNIKRAGYHVKRSVNALFGVHVEPAIQRTTAQAPVSWKAIDTFNEAFQALRRRHPGFASDLQAARWPFGMVATMNQDLLTAVDD